MRNFEKWWQRRAVRQRDVEGLNPHDYDLVKEMARKAYEKGYRDGVKVVRPVKDFRL